MKKIFSILIGFLFFLQQGNAQVTMSTPPQHGGWYRIMAVHVPGKYLCVEGSNTANGTKIVIADYLDQRNYKFLAQKNDDGTYSFFAGHSNKSICTEKGDNREGDLIIQNTLSQYFGKWYLSWMNTCSMGFKIQYKTSSGRPIQLTANGNECRLIEPIYQDGAADCPYLFLFEPVDAPAPKIEKPISSETRKTPQIKKNGN
jgi:hypothetical protein